MNRIPYHQWSFWVIFWADTRRKVVLGAVASLDHWKIVLRAAGRRQKLRSEFRFKFKSKSKSKSKPGRIRCDRFGIPRRHHNEDDKRPIRHKAIDTVVFDPWAPNSYRLSPHSAELARCAAQKVTTDGPIMVVGCTSEHHCAVHLDFEGQNTSGGIGIRHWWANGDV